MNLIKTSVFIVLIFRLIDSYSQTIDTLYTINKTHNSVEIVCKSVWFNSSCDLDSFSLESEDNCIKLNTYHTIGAWTAICHSLDTFTLSNIPEKNYKLVYKVLWSQDTSYNDSDTLYFTIGNPASINENTNPNISVYPNPFTNEIVIANVTQNWSATELKSLTFKIYTLLGKEIYSHEILQSYLLLNDGIKINCSQLPKGIYFLEINGIGLTKIIKQ